MATNKPYSSDDEFDDNFEDYDAHLGKCKKHISNVAVASKAKAAVKAKVIQLPKEKKQKVMNQQTTTNQQTKNKIQENANSHFKPITEEPVVDDWEDLI